MGAANGRRPELASPIGGTDLAQHVAYAFLDGIQADNEFGGDGPVRRADS
jgi:hypothetical protein